MVTVEKALTTTTPGEFRLFGNQGEFLVDVGLTNSSGLTIESQRGLADGFRVTLRQGDRAIPVEALVLSVEPGNRVVLAAGEGVRLKLAVRRLDGGTFDPGRYSMAIDVSDFLVSPRLDDGTRWSGSAKAVDTRQILVEEIVSVDDRIHLLDLEGNYHLSAGNIPEAIEYLEELVQLRPEAWQPNGALGAAYARAGRYRDASDSRLASCKYIVHTNG